jgi:transcription initiation factor TFIIE subunit alpha
MMPKTKSDEVGLFLANDAVRRELIGCAGENAIDILKLLHKETEDEKIAGVLKLKVSDVRSVLNKLNDLGITFYDRTRNEDTGWYYYNWSVDINKFRSWVNHTIKNQDARIRYSYLIEDEHYYCPQCGIGTSFRFNDAADLVFKCPSCSNTLELIEAGVLDKFYGRKKAQPLHHIPAPPSRTHPAPSRLGKAHGSAKKAAQSRHAKPAIKSKAAAKPGKAKKAKKKGKKRTSFYSYNRMGIGMRNAA